MPPLILPAPATVLREPSAREEWANAVSHGLGFVAAGVALSPPAALPAQGGAAVFAATMLLVFFASAVFHALPVGRAKAWFRRLDHAAIFLFIAGSYTPFALQGLHDRATAPAAALVWALAVAGALAKVAGRLREPRRSTAAYLALGWFAALAAVPALLRLPSDALTLLVAGGLAYTVGAAFYLADRRLRYGHFVWHLLVLAGSGCHYAAVLQL